MDNNHQFWSTQPVPQTRDQQSGNSEIEPDKDPLVIDPNPIALPDSFVWCQVNIQDPVQMAELYTLLSDNYIEDVDSKFRFDYSAEFLEWALLSPAWKKEWFLGIRTEPSHQLMGFIGAVQTRVKVGVRTKRMAIVDFLCVHKSLRSRRLAPLLIQEITRRVNYYGHLFQAIYTTGVPLPGRILTARYFHRPLNYSKLVDTGFSPLPFSLEAKLREYRMPRSLCCSGIRPMEDSDCSRVLHLLNNYLSTFALSCIFESEDDIRHAFLPRPNVVYSYVQESKGSITGFVSFYELASRILDNSSHPSLKVAYLYYHASENPEILVHLVESVLYAAKGMDFDVVNCLDIMDNNLFINRLKFVPGDGKLGYYIFNWRTESLDPAQAGILTL